MLRLEHAIAWFKNEFGDSINAAVEDTPFDIDLLAAIAVQETYEVWGDLYDRIGVTDLLELCVGDTIDAPRRKAFPRTKAQLLGAPNGDRMFDIARASLEAIGEYFAVYHKIAVANPNKFCHAFGIFQYDLQHFPENAQYFLERRWADFDACLALCIGELASALKSAFGRRKKKKKLSDEEKVFVAIAYNSGRVNFDKGFKQGYFDGHKYYGEYIRDFMDLARHVPA
ncbi:MAG TPA: SH3 domain-containing protein [Thermoanaerobaculia bacterium]